MQELWDTMKNPNLWIIGIEADDFQVNCIDHILNTIKEEVSPQIKGQLAYTNTKGTQHQTDKNRTFQRQVIIKTLNTQNKETLLKAIRGGKNHKSHIKKNA